MRILLDSHVALRWLDDSAAMGPHRRELISHADEAFISSVTPWELGIKRARGKLTMPGGLVDELESAGFVSLSIMAAHAESASALPPHHRDPFERMLVAQAQLETAVVVTADQALAGYDVERFDARS
ncbi:MAG: type II toxin-antitoxin system VapC family toxin [Acidimicrobiales bacterium]